MKRFTFEQSDDEFYTSHSGLALVGLCINRYSGLPLQISKKMKGNDVVSHTDIVRSFLGLLCLGKSDYEAISAMRNDTYFRQSLGIKNVPSAERLRQRLDEHAESLERLPSGKFATNSLIMSLAGLAYNILRFIGQLGLLGDRSPVRHSAKRRRIRTVIQELMYRAARLIETGRKLKLRFSRHCCAFDSFQAVYNRLAFG
ncbi:MAG: hypothetical protein BM485_11225 [Desulfobulbaceae bacterium DB1]|nr:MAG: hypothetical protein BM485_11225 [Desulfobulbaceae bacterium DB1]